MRVGYIAQCHTQNTTGNYNYRLATVGSFGFAELIGDADMPKSLKLPCRLVSMGEAIGLAELSVDVLENVHIALQAMEEIHSEPDDYLTVLTLIKAECEIRSGCFIQTHSV